MARLIKCPRCQSQVDVTSVAGGATVRCPDCGANLRVPTGQTGQHARVPSSASQPAVPGRAPKGGGKQTNLFRKMSTVKGPGTRGRPPSRSGGGGARGGYARKSSNTGLFVGLGVGALAIALVLVAVMMSGKEPPRNPAAAGNLPSPAASAPEPEMAAPEPDASAPAPEQPKKKAPGIKKSADGGYDIAKGFEPGARKMAEKQVAEWQDPVGFDAEAYKEFEKLASAGKVDEIVGAIGKWMPSVIYSMISDDEAVARSGYRALHDTCQKFNISSKEESFVNPIKMENFNSGYVRAGEYVFWCDWWKRPNNQQVIGASVAAAGADGEPARAAEDPGAVDWDDIMRDLRAGGAYNEIGRPEGLAFARVKAMGSGAYSHLVKYINNEDPLLGRAAVAVLNELTGRQGDLPTEQTRDQIRSEWESWVKRLDQ